MSDLQAKVQQAINRLLNRYRTISDDKTISPPARAGYLAAVVQFDCDIPDLSYIPVASLIAEIESALLWRGNSTNG